MLDQVKVLKYLRSACSASGNGRFCFQVIWEWTRREELKTMEGRNGGVLFSLIKIEVGLIHRMVYAKEIDNKSDRMVMVDLWGYKSFLPN